MTQQSEEEGLQTEETAAKEEGNTKKLQQKQSGILSTLLGPFTTKEFWIGLASHLAQQAMAAFLSALGGVLVYYGKKTFDGAMSSQAATSGGEEVSNRAFAGSFAPTPSYQDDFRPGRYTVENTPRGDNRFPGFGR
jgi:hypothetical protein